MRGLLKAVSLCWLITTGVASAQGWQPRVFDNASWFTISASIGRTATIYCGGRSAGGVPLPQTDEPLMTPDYQLMLTLDLPGLATQENYPTQRNDVMLVKGTTGYMLPNLQIDELNGFGWLQLLDMGDPLFAAMIDGGPFEIRADGTPIGQLPAAGLTEALSVVVAGCHQRWALIGTRIPAQAQAIVSRFSSTTAAPAKTNPIGTMARARARATEICEGGYTETEPAFLTGLIDGDSAPDTVIKWDAITCSGALSRPLCGASNCSAMVFLSQSAEPMDFLSQATSLVALSNGRTGLSIAGRFASCGANSLGCQTIWGWNGSELVQFQ